MEYAIIIILSILLCVSIYKNITLGITILRMEDSLEESLDLIEEKYSVMSEILKRPLFFDSPEVKSVVQEIRSVRASLHNVAAALEKNANNSIEEEVSDT